MRLRGEINLVGFEIPHILCGLFRTEFRVWSFWLINDILIGLTITLIIVLFLFVHRLSHGQRPLWNPSTRDLGHQVFLYSKRFNGYWKCYVKKNCLLISSVRCMYLQYIKYIHNFPPGTLLTVNGRIITTRYGSNIAESDNGKEEKLLR